MKNPRYLPPGTGPEKIVEKLVESYSSDKWLYNVWMRKATKQEIADVLVWNDSESLAEYSQFELLEVIAEFESGGIVPRSAQSLTVLRSELQAVIDTTADLEVFQCNCDDLHDNEGECDD